MQKCDFCGVENEDDAIRCRDCGTVPAAVISASEPSGRAAASEKMRKALVWYFAALVILASVYASEGDHPEARRRTIGLGALLHIAVVVYRILSREDNTTAPEPPRLSDAGYVELARGTKFEREGRAEEAMEVYREVAEEYAKKDAGRDAMKSLKSLEARLG